jgi:adenosylmethionine-8-amino-7-oxononanoate aminotransferase
VRQKGTILAWDIHQEISGYRSPIRERIISFYAEAGILIRPLGNTVYLLPPYCISAQELAQLYQVTLEFLETL